MINNRSLNKKCLTKPRNGYITGGPLLSLLREMRGIDDGRYSEPIELFNWTGWTEILPLERKNGVETTRSSKWQLIVCWCKWTGVLTGSVHEGWSMWSAKTSWKYNLGAELMLKVISRIAAMSFLMNCCSLNLFRCRLLTDGWSFNSNTWKMQHNLRKGRDISVLTG